MITFKQILSLSIMGSALIMSLASQASSLSSDLDSLGNNDEIIERARSLDPQNRVRIVQNRQVDRYNRVELALRGGLITGGDSYLDTSEYGGTFTYHLTPRWSVGANYNTYRYGLTNEGQKRFSEAEATYRSGVSDYDIAQVVYPEQSYSANLSWYPIYGKTNLFDITTAQFDVYVQAGFGQIRLTSPYENPTLAGSADSNLFSIGTGVGLWLSQHFTTRFEIRHEMYNNTVLESAPASSWTTISTSIGILL